MWRLSAQTRLLCLSHSAAPCSFPGAGSAPFMPERVGPSDRDLSRSSSLAACRQLPSSNGSSACFSSRLRSVTNARLDPIPARFLRPSSPFRSPNSPPQQSSRSVRNSLGLLPRLITKARFPCAVAFQKRFQPWINVPDALPLFRAPRAFASSLLCSACPAVPSS